MAGVVLPVAVGVELLVAHHLARHIARRDRLVLEAVALGHPCVEAGVRRRCAAAGLEVAARDGELLARVEPLRFAVLAVERGAARGDRDPGAVGVGVGRDAVFAGRVDHHREVAGVDLEALAGEVVAHAQLKLTLVRGQAHGVVVEFGEFHVRLAVHAQCRRADVDFGARGTVGPEAVAGGQGAVRLRVVPALVAGRREAHAALLQRQARHTARRVLLRGRGGAETQQRQAEQPSVERASRKKGKRGAAGAVHWDVSGGPDGHRQILLQRARIRRRRQRKPTAW
jgi:hypothetical protein